ncbi:MAG: hypothetical protein Ct9H300mP18_07390 [Candidatus Neomarinimicrobiota bacterium]|nr:MAG: hypothetical protein Ct9H300mP18_07390 [Candidatus Neomarinimicrobiota bacterium]
MESISQKYKRYKTKFIRKDSRTWSKNLPHTLKNLMVESDNLTAELLIKTIGYGEK